jgi:hypothetical protein
VGPRNRIDSPEILPHPLPLSPFTIRHSLFAIRCFPPLAARCSPLAVFHHSPFAAFHRSPLAARRSLFTTIRHSLLSTARRSLLAARFSPAFSREKSLFGKILPFSFDRTNFRVHIYTKTSEHYK